MQRVGLRVIPKANVQRALCARRALLSTVSSTKPSLVLTPEDLARLLSHSQPAHDIVPIDASWHMPGSPRNSRTEFETKRVPGARFLDLDGVATTGHALNLPHMMPSSEVFKAYLESVGVTPSSHVVLYDSVGVFSSPRALFMFKAFGHRNASILNGGLPAWENLRRTAIKSGPSKSEPQASEYPTPKLNEAVLRDYEAMKSNAARTKDAELVLDARATGRFTGVAPEPRPGLPSGHIPSSLSVPFQRLLTNEKHSYETEDSSSTHQFTTLRSSKELRKVFSSVLSEETVQALVAASEDKGSVSAPRIVNTCGSGMTAAIVWLALKEIGIDSALYDESWMGYAARPESVIATGE